MKVMTEALRHVGGVVTQAALLAATVGLLALVFSPVYGPARTLTGADGAAAGRAGGNTIEVVGASSTARVVAAYGTDVTTYATLAKDYYLVYVRVTCTADGARVYEKWANIKTGDWTTDGYATFALGSSSWTGGSATCTADLLNAYMKGSRRVYATLASTTFGVAG